MAHVLASGDYNAAMVVDSALYVDGHRVSPGSLQEAYRACHDPGKFAWVALYEPSEEEIVSAAREFQLHGLAVEDATRTHQRPKLERYGDCLFAVLKPASYPEKAKISLDDIRAFVGKDFIFTIHYGEDPVLDEVRQRMESEPDRLRRGPTTVFCEVLQRVVEGYLPVVEELENDIDDVEEEVLDENAEVSDLIHRLFREVIRFHQVTKPLAGALARLLENADDTFGVEARHRLRRAHDRVLRVTEQVEGFRDLLSSILDVNLTMVGVQQNNQMQKISAWGAILIAPTLMAGIFGMNLGPLSSQRGLISPELDLWLSLGLMLLVSVLLYLRFKRIGWL